MKKILAIIIIALLFILNIQIHAETMHAKQKSNCIEEEKILGIDANYVLDMDNLILRTWRYGFRPIDVYSFFSSKGANYLRLRVFAKDNGSYGLHYATQTAKMAQKHSMECCVVLFLSSDWSDVGKQPAPESWIKDYDWHNKSIDQKCDIVFNYTRNTTYHFLNNGIDADLYEIGNEIDFGICGIFEDDLTKRENVSFMENTTWQKMAQIINAAIKGVQSVDTTSEFILHITHWWDFNFSSAFFNYMISSDVKLDYMGLSFYPSSGIYNLTETLQGKGNGTLSQNLFKTIVSQLSEKINRKIIVSEYAYPSSSCIIGQFSWFNHEVNGYPLTRQGQKEWLSDFLKWSYNQSYIAGTFYWSPEFFFFIWSPFSLFSYFGFAKPAIDAFKPYL